MAKITISVSNNSVEAPAMRGGTTPRPDRRFSALSDDAKAVLGAHFGLMSARGSVTFQTPWNRSERGAAALAELVDTGFLSVAAGEEGRWAWSYRVVPGSDYDPMVGWKWCGENTEKLKGMSVMAPAASRREKPPRGWKGILSDGALEASRRERGESNDPNQESLPDPAP